MRQLCHSARILLWGTINVSQKRKSYIDLIYAVFHEVLCSVLCRAALFSYCP